MRVVFFDGYCNLCNSFVDFLVRRDHQKRLRFASLQGDTAKKMLPHEYTSHLGSVVLNVDGQIYVESEAAIRTIATLGGIYSLMTVFMIVPAFIRNAVYRFIAKRRYLWFGKRDTCRLPSPEEKELFLP